MRADMIHDVLEHHFHEVGVAVSRLNTPELYKQLPFTPTQRMGIYGPVPYPEPGVEPKETDPPLMMAWSPEYIDMMTDDFPDELLDHYLGILAYVGDMMIALQGEIPDETERFRSIEDRFVDEWQNSAEVMAMVELKALDMAESAEGDLL